MGVPMLKIRRSWDRLIFNMRIPILVRCHLYIEMVPRALHQYKGHLSILHLDSPYKDKMVMTPYFLYNGNSGTVQITFSSLDICSINAFWCFASWNIENLWTTMQIIKEKFDLSFGARASTLGPSCDGTNAKSFDVHLVHSDIPMEQIKFKWLSHNW